MQESPMCTSVSINNYAIHFSLIIKIIYFFPSYKRMGYLGRIQTYKSGSLTLYHNPSQTFSIHSPTCTGKIAWRALVNTIL